MKIFIAFLLGNVGLFAALNDTKKVDKISFKSDFAQGVVSSDYQRIILKGNAVVISKDFQLRADEFEIYGEDNAYIKAKGNVYYENFKEQMNVKAQSLFFNRRLDLFQLEKQVELEDLKDKMILKAEYIEGDNKSELYIMQYSVKIYKNETFITCEYATYKKKETLIILEGLPRIYKDDDKYEATRIIFNTKTDKFKLEGNVEGEFFQKENSNKKSTE